MPSHFGEAAQFGGNGTESRKTLSGVVVEVRPKALFRVTLEDGKTVLAGPSVQLRHAIVRLVVGDRVTVQLSTHDPSRGRIIAKA
ncbi:MAG: translation initiation factor IF-1 [Myxococcales bacterium]|nr:translation initiation factor IF-1 [Myxococcales bacterium]